MIKLEAEDSDTGRNGLVEYSLDLQQEDPRTLQTFSLNSTSGELTTKVALDRETVENYKVGSGWLYFVLKWYSRSKRFQEESR